jgi:hypothetical protein
MKQLATNFDVSFLLALALHSEDGNDILLRNVYWPTTDYTTLYRRRQRLSWPSLCESQILHTPAVTRPTAGNTFAIHVYAPTQARFPIIKSWIMISKIWLYIREKERGPGWNVGQNIPYEEYSSIKRILIKTSMAVCSYCRDMWLDVPTGNNFREF